MSSDIKKKLNVEEMKGLYCVQTHKYKGDLDAWTFLE